MANTKSYLRCLLLGGLVIGGRETTYNSEPGSGGEAPAKPFSQTMVNRKHIIFINNNGYYQWFIARVITNGHSKGYSNGGYYTRNFGYYSG